MGEGELPDVPHHPVLRLMEASTTATVEHSARLQAIEKSSDRAAAALERLALAEDRRIEELRRKSDLAEREIALREKQYGERWSSVRAVASDARTSLVKVVSHPAFTLPMGAVGYGVARFIAGAFGFDLGVLP